MPLQATSGAASYDAFGGGVPVVPAYIEDVFSTWLFTGTGASQTITNGIDISGKGGLVWLKGRNLDVDNVLVDTARSPTPSGGVVTILRTNSTYFANSANLGWAWNNNGFTTDLVGSSQDYVSWTFRKQPKFFDVVSFTSNASYGATFSHNLASTPGFVIIKCTASAEYWIVWHRSLGNSLQMSLNTSDAQQSVPSWITTSSTSITVTNGYLSYANTSYVAYVFAHNAGGFGLTGTDNVISCGSFTTNASSEATVNLGYEPQWMLIKRTNGVDSWFLSDNMRQFTATQDVNSVLQPNTSGAELTYGGWGSPTSTGWTSVGNSSNIIASATYIYIAVRRGPMKVPTSGTSVFSPNTTSAATGTAITTNFPVDLQLIKYRTGAQATMVLDRLRGISSNSDEFGVFLRTSNTNAEVQDYTVGRNWNNTGYQVASGWTLTNQINWNFRRAPSFFDEVCYTGTGAAGRTVTHNLGVAPQLVITKGRDTTTTYGDWMVLPPTLQNVKLNEDTSQDDSSITALYFGNGTSVVAPTSTVFTLGSENTVNQSGKKFVAYLFATCAGVSKVGSYTGTATTKQIDCGFTSGARFVLIKRVDGVGAWYVWDTARGIVSGNDPYLLLNTTAAEVTNTDYIDTYSAGFEISSTAPAALNASGGTFIFLAIA